MSYESTANSPLQFVIIHQIKNIASDSELLQAQRHKW